MNRFSLNRISRFVLLALVIFGLALTPILQSCSSPPQQWELVAANISFVDPGDSEEYAEAPEVDFLIKKDGVITSSEIDAWLSDVLSAMQLGENAKIKDFVSNGFKFVTLPVQYPSEGTIVQAIDVDGKIKGQFTLHADD